MNFIIKEGVDLICASKVKWLWVPFAPIVGSFAPPILSPFFIALVIVVLAVRYGPIAYLNTDSSGEKSWKRSLLSAFLIWYMVACIVTILVIGFGCKLSGYLGPGKEAKEASALSRFGQSQLSEKYLEQLNAARAAQFAQQAEAAAYRSRMQQAAQLAQQAAAPSAYNNPSLAQFAGQALQQVSAGAPLQQVAASALANPQIQQAAGQAFQSVVSNPAVQNSARQAFEYAIANRSPLVQQAARYAVNYATQ